MALNEKKRATYRGPAVRTEALTSAPPTLLMCTPPLVPCANPSECFDPGDDCNVACVSGCP